MSDVSEAASLDLVFETRDGPVHALSNANMSVAPGDFLNFIGASACEKTTFLRLIGDMGQPKA